MQNNKEKFDTYIQDEIYSIRYKMLSLINNKKLNYLIGQRDKVSRKVIHTK